jgi:hypothetical protein
VYQAIRSAMMEIMANLTRFSRYQQS